MNQSPLPSHTPRSSALDGLVARARAALVWERAWPRLALAGSLVALFAGLSWLGLWPLLPPLARLIAVAAFACAILAVLAPLALLALPGRAAGLARIDAASGEPHRPATALADTLAAGDDDPLSRALWQRHHDDMAAREDRLTAGLPRPGLAARDPRALRFAVLLLAVVGFFVAGQERLPRLMQAFDWRGATTPATPPRLDAWVTPPPYTRRPPVYLTAQDAPTGPLDAPAGSTVAVRVSGGEVDVIAKGGLEADKAPADGASPDAVREWSFTLNGDAELRAIPGAGGTRVWRFTAIPDRAPEIAFTEPPRAGPRGQTILSYRTDDDHGVTAAEARIEHAAPKPDAAPLVAPPKLALVLPPRRAADGAAVTSADLVESPYAGAPVRITLEARDAAGNTGRSLTVETVLPERAFRDPLARALVEQRRNLALDINARRGVERALDALALYPEQTTPRASTYLALRSLYWRLKGAEGREELLGVVDYMWQVALRLEDGELSDIERNLKAARDALREALERGASPEELRQLTDNLRKAMESFLAEMARRAQQNAQAPGSPPPGARMVRPEDLRSMLDRLQEFAQRGSRDAAKDMLSELDRILEGLNPNTARQMDPMSEEMARMLDQLGEMIREQNELRDRTFREGQGQSGQQQPRDRQNPQGQPGQDGAQGLAQDQNALRQRLQELMRQLQEKGLQPGQEMGQAGEEMGSAGEQLGQGNAGGAVGPQGRALEALRQGAQGLAQQMFGDGEGDGQGQPGGEGNPRMGQRGNDQDVDPLGRPTRSRRYDPGSSVRVPGEIDAQRARRVLEELRRRLSDPSRPGIETDYLERLIEP